MKNITVTVDEETYRRARVRAAELDTSVSRVVQNFLKEFASNETDFERRKRLQDELLKQVRSFRAGDRLKREDVYKRNASR